MMRCGQLPDAFAFALLYALAWTAPAAAQVPRQVSAPASDVLGGRVRLPDPASTPSISAAAVLPVRFEAVGSAWIAEARYPVERSGPLVLLWLTPSAAGCRLLAGAPGVPLQPLDELEQSRALGFAGESLPGWIAERRELRHVAAGEWRIRIEFTGRMPPEGGWLLVSAGAEIRAEAYVATQRRVAGLPIAIVARARGRDVLALGGTQLLLETESAELALAMEDDGAHEDGEAGDGLFGAFLPAGLLGRIRARVELSGITLGGQAFLRNAPLAFSVLEPALLLDGRAEVALLEAARLRIAPLALPQGPERRLHVSAEVWGRDALGRELAVCWLSRMLERPEPSAARAGLWELPLELDLDWLAATGARAPLELRNVRVQDPGTEAVLDLLERIELETPPLPATGATAITARMLSGLSGPPGAPAPRLAGGLNADTYARSLMLVHGYCSGGSIWPAADFSEPKLEFLDANANRTHDEFAQLLAQQAAAAGVDSFGVVAHSQGGAAALHLYTYYVSGLQLASWGRRIQSVATPYQGTPLASLGFFACGVNDNMTPSGAATWLAGIPSWARAEVFYWTTSNSGSACNFFTNLLLTDPEDGTVEKFRGQLPGGNDMGHVVGWCHTTGMSNPASYTDHARNQAMNAAAAR